MPANSRWDLIRGLRVNILVIAVAHCTDPQTSTRERHNIRVGSPVFILFTEMNINLILRNELSLVLGYKWQFLEP